MSDQPEPFDITVEMDPPYAAEVDPALLVHAARRVLEREGVRGPLDLGVWITNEEELRTLNRAYRGLDESTDVLSFGADDEQGGAFVKPPDESRHLGDVAISFPHAVRQALALGHSRTYELAWLLTHGILHLLGYDHEEPADLKEMRAHEDAALDSLGIPNGETHGGDRD